MRRTRRFALVALAVAICTTFTTAVATVAQRQLSPASDATATSPRGVQQLAAAPEPRQGGMIGIATFGGRRPSEAKQRALEGLGLQVQVLRRLPLALLYGTKAQLESAVERGIAADVYPNERLEWASEESTASIRADVVRSLGVTGKGVGVAIVDSGIDATHPDLADHVTHNVKLVGPEYLSLAGIHTSPDTATGTLVVPVDQTPYNNSDTIGHGTHVAGIVAADAHTSPTQVGVAPDAHLIGYGTGEVAFLFTVVAALDDVLVHQEEWGIRVVNNSWSSGFGFRAFDPDHPVNVATRHLSEAGVAVIFAAGNDAEEMTISDYAIAPWVVAVGAATIAKERSSFSSGGLEHDNSQAASAPKKKQLHFQGDRIGLYHPDVSAPGTDIVSSGTPTGVGVIAPTPPGGTAELSGTSMAAPHVAGVAALLLEARPSLTPAQIREVMQVTAVPMKDGSPFWRSGYGFVDAAAAVDLVRRPDFGPALLARLQSAADARVLGERGFAVLTTDFWSYRLQPVSALGSDTREFKVTVTPATKAVKASVAFPGGVPVVGVNAFEYELVLKDADGKTVASGQAPETQVGVRSLFVDLVNPGVGPDGKPVPPPEVAYGEWTVEVSGIVAASDPEMQVGNLATVFLAQLVPQPRVLPPTPTVYVPSGQRRELFRPEGDAGPLISPEGCAMEGGPPNGGMGAAPSPEACRAGVVGFAVNHGADLPAVFTSAPLDVPTVVGGPAVLTLYLADAAAPVWSQAFRSRVSYVLEAVDAEGRATLVAGADLEKFAEAGPTPTRGEYALTVPPTVVPEGSRLRLQLRFSGVYTLTMRLLYGGPYADSGLARTTGSFVSCRQPGGKQGQRALPRGCP